MARLIRFGFGVWAEAVPAATNRLAHANIQIRVLLAFFITSAPSPDSQLENLFAQAKAVALALACALPMPMRVPQRTLETILQKRRAEGLGLTVSDGGRGLASGRSAPAVNLWAYGGVPSGHA